MLLEKRDITFIVALVTIILMFTVVFKYGEKDKSLTRVKGFAYNRSYTLKSIDGSNRVPIFDEMGKIAEYVPDGTEMEIWTYQENGRNRIWVDGQDWRIRRFVNPENIGDETEKSLKARTGLGIASIFFIVQMLLTLVCAFLIYLLIRKYAQMKYEAYYEKKRKEYTWLDSFIDISGNPSAYRAHEKTWLMSILVGSFYLITNVYAQYRIATIHDPAIRAAEAGSVTIYVLVGFGGTFLIMAGWWGLWWLWTLITISPAKDADDYRRRLTLECPSCKCPHSWELTESNVTNIESKTTTTTTTKWKERHYEDGTKEKVAGSETTKVQKHTTYQGTYINDYKCENCDHREHKEYRERWHPEYEVFETNVNALPNYYDTDEIAGAGDIGKRMLEYSKKYGLLILKYTLLLPDKILWFILQFYFLRLILWFYFTVGLGILFHYVGQEILTRSFMPIITSKEDALNDTTALIYYGACALLSIFLYITLWKWNYFKTVALILMAMSIFGYVTLGRALMELTPLFPNIINTLVGI